MRRLMIKTSLFFTALLFSAVSFSQQGGQANPGNQANPANPGVQAQPGQNVQNTQAANPASPAGQENQNDQYTPTLQPGESYPVDQNLQLNKEYLTNPLDNQSSSGMGVQNNQDQLTPGVQNLPAQGVQNPVMPGQNQVTPGVQNQGPPEQTLPAGQGSQNVPGNTGNGMNNQINPGINNNPGVPNDAGMQNPDSIQKDKNNLNSKKPK